MAAASRIGICNKAISRIKAKAIQSLGEESLEARECNRHYPDVIAEMLEGPHDWSFQNRRAALAVTTNDRSGEWLFAYALPADMGTPIRVLPDLTALGAGYPVPLPGEPYAEVWSTFGWWDAPYLIENGVLYANIEVATLEYGINSIEEVSLGALVQKAIVADLASRIAKPIKGDDKLADSEASKAELFWQRAMADDQNRNPQRQDGYVSEVMAARHGYAPVC